MSFSRFQKTALSKIQWSEWTWFGEEKDQLSVSFRLYSKNECKELLSKDLISRGYQPIQIDIVNSTPYEYEITPADVSLPSEKPSKMALKVMKSALPRSMALRIAGLFFWPVNIIGAIDSLNSFSSFEDMRTDWKSMCISPNEKVPPFSTLHRVIFVPDDHLTDSFNIQLKNVKTGEYETFESTASLHHIAKMQNNPTPTAEEKLKAMDEAEMPAANAKTEPEQAAAGDEAIIAPTKSNGDPSKDLVQEKGQGEAEIKLINSDRPPVASTVEIAQENATAEKGSDNPDEIPVLKTAQDENYRDDSVQLVLLKAPSLSPEILHTAQV